MLIGNLGRDAETKFTPSGQARTTFSIATTRQWKDRQTGENKEQTDWHNIVAWGKERVAEYLKKGGGVLIAASAYYFEPDEYWARVARASRARAGA